MPTRSRLPLAELLGSAALPLRGIVYVRVAARKGLGAQAQRRTS